MKLADQSIVIACSDKKDRLTFFNYFDALNVEKILTASHMEQMTELLHDEEHTVALLAVEISSQWIKSVQQLSQIRDEFPEVQIIGLVGDDIRFDFAQYKDIKQWVSKLLYAPLSNNQLVSLTALLNKKNNNIELDNMKPLLEAAGIKVKDCEQTCISLKCKYFT